MRPESGPAVGAVIFLDGELYIERAHAPAVIRQLRDIGHMSSWLAVFVSNNGAAARHVDLTCSEAYAAFVVEEVLAWILQQHQDIDHGRVVVAGVSLSGLAAAFVAVRYPDMFSAAICQSPSFWWNGEQFRQRVPQAADLRPHFWVSVGDQETSENISHPPSGLWQQTSQLEACWRTCETLRTRGYTVAERVFSGGHDCDCWREDLAGALPWAERTTSPSWTIDNPDNSVQ